MCVHRTRDVSAEEKRNVRQLYDVPYMFEAREFLRTKLIHKKVSREHTCNVMLLTSHVFVSPASPAVCSLVVHVVCLLLMFVFVFMCAFSCLLQVNVTVDYVRPSQDGFPERICATVLLGET